jgi:predicted nucleotidyltransferase
MKTILEGIVGSVAYGLNTADSDIDTRGAFVVPTQDLLRLRKPKDTYVTTTPDTTLYEVEKFLRLAAQNNPNVLELLYLESYEILSEEGKAIVAIRDSFLSQKIRNTYGGYAISQVKRLESRADGSFKSKLRTRYSKHARHCFRLLRQGRQLLEEGSLTVRVENRDELFAVGELEPEELKVRFEEEFEKFNAVESYLPMEPDYEEIDRVLLWIRVQNQKW